MSPLWVIPAKTATSLKRGMTGIVVWSLQKGLNRVGTDIALDGIFGEGTEARVKSFQKSNRLSPIDGIAGPQTQRALAALLCDDTVQHYDLPDGLLYGYAEGEGGWYLGAVNHQVAGGIDCGLFQRRVYASDYEDDKAIQRAFDTTYQGDLLAQSLVERRGVFAPRAGTRDGTIPAGEKAWRLAALNHNYPAGADRLSRTPIKALPSYWTTPQEWVTDWGFKFPDGSPVRTPLDWCHLYAGVLGAGVKGSRGSVTRYVRTWA